MRPQLKLYLIAGLLAAAWAVGRAEQPPPPDGPKHDASAASPVTVETLKTDMRELRRAAMSAPQGGKPSSRELLAIIQQVENADPSGRKNTPATQPAAATTVTLRPARLDAQTLQRLKNAPAQGPASAVKLADSLYASNNLEAAIAVYGVVLTQEQPEGTKAWALFQSANCLRTADPAAAKAMYHRVTAEYAASLWATLAAEEERYIDWQQSVRPQAILDSVNAGGAR